MRAWGDETEDNERKSEATSATEIKQKTREREKTKEKEWKAVNWEIRSTISGCG